MSVRRFAGGGKRDAAEPAIIDALTAIHARVWRIGGPGNPDLLVLFHGQFFPCEVKTGAGRRTTRQRDIPWPIVRTPEEMFRYLGATT